MFTKRMALHEGGHLAAGLATGYGFVSFRIGSIMLLKKDGRLYSVVPAPEHLFELKELLYEKPYQNDTRYPGGSELTLAGKHLISHTVNIPQNDLKTLFSMTPYFYRTSESDKAKINRVDALKTTLAFMILEYKAE